MALGVAVDRVHGRQQPGEDGAEEDGEHEPADRPERGLRVVAEPPSGQQRRRAGRSRAQQSRRLSGQPRARHDQADQDQSRPGRADRPMRCELVIASPTMNSAMPMSSGSDPPGASARAA